jgi:hypothetical protein
MALNQFVMPGFAAYRIGIEPINRQTIPENLPEPSDSDDIMDAEHMDDGPDIASASNDGAMDDMDVRDSLEDSE